MDPKAIAYLAAGFGAGIVILGAAFGIGKLAAAEWKQADVSRKSPHKYVYRC